MATKNLLIIADSERDADMLYGTGLFVPDPFIFIRKAGQTHLVLSDLEIDRASRLCPHATIHSLTALRSAVQADGKATIGLADIAAVLLRQLRLKNITVPPTFPLSHARVLEATLPELRLSTACPFPERSIKSSDEIKKIQAILKITEQGLQAGIELIRQATPGRNGILRHRNRPLTSEAVRGAIHAEISSQGGIPCNTIVAGGEQACDPHERGHGPLPAHSPIILDVFPRSESTGYFGDITRTVVRGTPSDALGKMYEAVGKAQRTGMTKIRAGAKALRVHQDVQRTFVELGYLTRRHNNHMEGFFHGTGHGLGLEIHEGPGIGATTRDTLQSGQVVTVEPGLYYPGLGGIRLEDVVVVQAGRPRKLTRLPHQFVI